jgi:hypothetical protein
MSDWGALMDTCASSLNSNRKFFLTWLQAMFRFGDQSFLYGIDDRGSVPGRGRDFYTLDHRTYSIETTLLHVESKSRETEGSQCILLLRELYRIFCNVASELFI